MKNIIGSRYNSLLLVYALLYSGFEVNALSYDYTASIECLANPYKAQYGGGLVINPELDNGLKGWSAFGDAKIQNKKSQGNKFIVAHKRNQPHDSVSQKFYLQKNKLYTFSAWLQVNKGIAPITAVFKTAKGFKQAGAVVAESKCWSFLKGGLTVDESGPVELYFESKNTSVDIWVDSISLQPFTEEQWKSHQLQSVEKARKRKVRIQIVDEQGNPISNRNISIQQKASNFPFGCAINKNILNNTAYQNWYTSRSFKVTTFEDEMKWYSTEQTQGHEDYSVSDAMFQFAKQHNLAVRGHNVLWDDPNYLQSWVKSLSRKQLFDAASKRLNSVMSRYKGQVIGWDVVNENLNNNFFEKQLGKNASGMIYNWALKVDGATTMFMNEYNTIEDPRDVKATPAQYLQKLREIQSFSGNNKLKMGIGLESHFGVPNIPYIRSSIDTLAATGLPVWITELDVKTSPNQANYLEQILREVHSHPQVEGIVIWAAWKPQGCYAMCLTDNNFNNLPSGDVVDKLMQEWGLKQTITNGFTDANGFYEASLFHGDYQLLISHPLLKNSSLFTQSFNVAVATVEKEEQTRLLLQVPA